MGTYERVVPPKTPMRSGGNTTCWVSFNLKFPRHVVVGVSVDDPASASTPISVFSSAVMPVSIFTLLCLALVFHRSHYPCASSISALSQVAALSCPFQYQILFHHPEKARHI